MVPPEGGDSGGVDLLDDIFAEDESEESARLAAFADLPLSQNKDPLEKECSLNLMDLNHDSHYWRIICSQLHLDEFILIRS